MRLAKKIFLLLFGLFFTTIILDIMAQYYFYEFAYPSYKKNQIYQVVKEVREDVKEFEFFSDEFLKYVDKISSDHLIEYDLYSIETDQLNVELLDEDQIYFESRDVESIKKFYYYTIITFNDGEQLIIEINYSLQILGEMLAIFKNYYIFIFIILAILVLFFAIWLTEQLTKPLLHMKQVTEHIAKIDFSEKCDIDSNDELQELATNINIMSDNLHNTLTELQIANERLQDDIAREREFEQMRSNFFATISHELKTPLTSIMGASELLKNNLVKDKDINVFANNIYNEAKRLLNLVHNIIKISRLDEQNNLEYSNININALTSDIINQLKDKINNRNITINYNNNNNIIINAIPTILHEILYNLCDNAINYNIDNGSIDINISKDTNNIIWTIKDTGIGIQQNELDRIFERFYRVDKSHSKETGGSGLGLSIVKKIVEDHGGYIWATSEEGNGTCIHFMIRKYKEKKNE